MDLFLFRAPPSSLVPIHLRFHARYFLHGYFKFRWDGNGMDFTHAGSLTRECFRKEAPAPAHFTTGWNTLHDRIIEPPYTTNWQTMVSVPTPADRPSTVMTLRCLLVLCLLTRFPAFLAAHPSCPRPPSSALHRPALTSSTIRTWLT
ncbi:hypothetical protein PAPYR_11854 [Paratrimastix pyriformis]|uniref:Uncharacterized protein n=1 Tax=Paratrimastix pyriformis TaxID=342808 RepID=A0ABQ8U9Z0_9EUKA|nr:hypothetical protein PAPYR_11854 [Paratrimastix pyriformis]